MCFDLVELDGIIEMDFDVALIIKYNTKIFFIKEIKHLAYAPAELLTESILTHRA